MCVLEVLKAHTPESIGEQIKRQRVPVLFEIIRAENEALASFGVTTSVAIIVNAASSYGDHYEDDRFIGGLPKATPLNCLMGLVHQQPRLLELPLDKFEELGGVIARISMATLAIVEKRSHFDWPRDLTESPQKSLKLRKSKA